jgi:hypothetical protein
MVKVCFFLQPFITTIATIAFGRDNQFGDMHRYYGKAHFRMCLRHSAQLKKT